MALCFFAVAGTRAAMAQCPDGTPPPCRAPQLASAASRRTPPLDDRTWLVLPFDNLARDPGLDAVRDASVLLLYLELSRWTDIRVIDDTRVADLMRGVPAGARLGQETGFDIARRVGAGKLVMGTLIKEGARTGIVAGVFDVRTGQRLRSPRESTTGTDSLSVVFGRLAQGILAVPQPGGGTTSAASTTSTEALRAYAAGMATWSRWRPDSTELHMRRAVALDPNFAMARLHLGAALREQGLEEQAQQELDAAARLGDALPPRERLIVRYWRGSAAEHCAVADQLLRADSAEIWGWIARGGCEPGPPNVDASGAAPRFLGPSRSERIRAYEQALQLDPRNALAASSLLSLYIAGGRAGCAVAVAGSCPGEHVFLSAPIIEADTIALRPMRWRDAPFANPLTSRSAQAARRILSERQRDASRRFSEANPRQWLFHWQLAEALMYLGDLPAAERELDAAGEAAQVLRYRRRFYFDRVVLELMKYQAERARILADSMFLDRTAADQPQFGTVFGRFTRDLSATDTGTIRAIRVSLMPVYAGVAPSGLDTLIEQFADARAALTNVEAREDVRRAIRRQLSMIAFHARRSGVGLDTSSASALVRYQAFAARGDTARARRELDHYDRELAEQADDLDDGGLVFSAESHLELGDSAEALRQVQEYVRRWGRISIGQFNIVGYLYFPMSSPQRLAGRAWLLYADLAMSRGLREEARRGYRFVVGLWEGGEPPVQPLVARARAALARLGN